MNQINEGIEDILKKYRTVAIVGLSNKPDRSSYVVARYLKEHGFRIIPVNPGHEEILGEKCYPSLLDIPVEIDIVDIFRKPELVEEIVDQAIEKGAKVVWMQLGVVNPTAAEKALKAGLRVVMDRCMKIELSKLNY